MKKIYHTEIDSDERDCIIIDNEHKHSEDLFFFEIVNYYDGELWSTTVALDQEEALDLAKAIIKELK